MQTVIEAAGGGAQVQWAAAMLSVGAGRQLLLTTDRGRGWLPAEAVLPADVLLPWAHEDAGRWEGLRDPARVLVEYAHAVGGRLTALASTYSSSPAVAAGIPWSFADSSDIARPEMVGGPMVTRFELQVAESHRNEIKSISDPAQQREQALWFAFDADALAGASESRARLLAELREHLSRLNQPRWVDGRSWDALIAEHHDLMVGERASRVDGRDVAVGQLDLEDGGYTGRPLLAQAYASEALLAIRQPVAARALADAAYAWSMLRALPEAPPAVAPIHPISSQA